MNKYVLWLVVVLAASLAACGGPFKGNAQIISDRLETAIAAEDACRAQAASPPEERLISRSARERVARLVCKEGSADATRFIAIDAPTSTLFRQFVNEAEAHGTLNRDYAAGAMGTAKGDVALSTAVWQRISSERELWSDEGSNCQVIAPSTSVVMNVFICSGAGADGFGGSGGAVAARSFAHTSWASVSARE
jgi:hypothetical protein